MAKSTELTREQINQYIWKRYIDNTSNYTEVDEQEALRFFERYYAKHPLNEDDECFYFGILCFEMAFQREEGDEQIRLIRKAKEVMEIYRTASGEDDWDAIEDRLEECREFMESIPAETTVSVVETPAAAVAAAPKIVDGMILIESGMFRFGPEREQKFLEAFFIDIAPVSNKEYRAFIEAVNFRAPGVWDKFPELADDALPVTGVSWMDALKYCEWANKELLTEEQWEKAARGIDGRLYPWGDTPPADDSTCFASSPNAKLKALNGFDANRSPYGCRFMVGHVWEWTSTTFMGEGRYRVLKGGSWADPNDPRFLSTHARLWANVKEKSELIGFRCARPVKNF